jgi:hypothetical protein
MNRIIRLALTREERRFGADNEVAGSGLSRAISTGTPTRLNRMTRIAPKKPYHRE